MLPRTIVEKPWASPSAASSWGIFKIGAPALTDAA
jgi:hypothetical protein